MPNELTVTLSPADLLMVAGSVFAVSLVGCFIGAWLATIIFDREDRGR